MQPSAICMLHTRFRISVLYSFMQRKMTKKKPTGKCFLKIKYEWRCLLFEYHYRHTIELPDRCVRLWTIDKLDWFEHCDSMSSEIYDWDCNTCDRRARDTEESERAEWLEWWLRRSNLIRVIIENSLAIGKYLAYCCCFARNINSCPLYCLDLRKWYSNSTGLYCSHLESLPRSIPHRPSPKFRPRVKWVAQ